MEDQDIRRIYKSHVNKAAKHILKKVLIFKHIQKHKSVLKLLGIKKGKP